MNWSSVFIMIDTIKLRYPADEYLVSLFDKYSESLYKCSPDGEVLWERKSCQDYLPSHFGGLRVNTFNPSHFNSKVFSQDFLTFEFSLQKWQSETGYNQDNTSIEHDINCLHEWVNSLSNELQYVFQIDKFVVYRIDLSENLELINGAVPDYLRSLEIKFSRGAEKVHRYPGGIMQGSSWLSKKIYWKWGEFESIEKKKNRGLYAFSEDIDKKPFNKIKRPLTIIEQGKLVRMMRFEIEFRRDYLKKHSKDKVINICDLRAKFLEEKNKFITTKRLKDGIGLLPVEYIAVDLTKRFGLSGAKIEFTKLYTERYWYKTKRNLRAKDVYLESIVNEDFRGEIESVDNCADFDLQPCAYIA